MSEIEQKTLEGIDGFFNKLTEATDIVATKLIDVAPEAAEALLNLVQFKGIFNVTASLLVTFFLILCAAKIAPRLIKWAKEDEYNPAPLIIMVVGGLGWVVMFASSLICFLSFYNWLAAFYPEGAVAFKALAAVGIDL